MTPKLKATLNGGLIAALRTSTPALLLWILYQLDALTHRVNELQALVMQLLAKAH